MRRDASYFGTLSGPRLRHEFELLFHEPTAPEAASRAEHLGLLQAIHPALHLSDELATRWHGALQEAPLGPLDELGFCLICDPRDEGTVASVSRWLHLEGRVQTTLGDLVRLRSQSPKLASMHGRPSEITELLDGFAPSAVWARAVLDGNGAGADYVEYLRSWRHIRPALSGDDLIALGATAGPALGATLRSLRAARLDGQVTTREAELRMVQELL